LAFGAQDGEDGENELWIRDLDRGTETRMTVDAGIEINPIWTPLGQEVVFTRFNRSSDTPLQVFEMRSDGSGSARVLTDGFAAALTPDGGEMIVIRAPEGETLGFTGNANLWLVPRTGTEEARPLLEGPDRMVDAAVSPDGRWLAYQAQRSGVSQVYLTRFPEATGRWQVSVGEGTNPEWDPRGGRLYFAEGTKLMEVTLEPTEIDPGLGQPTELFDMASAPGFTPRGFAITPEGDRFAIPEASIDISEDESSRPGIKIVQNWIREFEP
jgi:Tol biopolymer transport system component